jgi:hypothetical protein
MDRDARGQPPAEQHQQLRRDQVAIMPPGHDHASDR